MPDALKQVGEGTVVKAMFWNPVDYIEELHQFCFLCAGREAQASLVVTMVPVLGLSQFTGFGRSWTW